MILILLVLILVLSAWSLLDGQLLHGVIVLSAVSLLSAVVFYLYRAPDVAITEAAVGAGVSTVIFVWAIRATEEKNKP